MSKDLKIPIWKKVSSLRDDFDTSPDPYIFSEKTIEDQISIFDENIPLNSPTGNRLREKMELVARMTLEIAHTPPNKIQKPETVARNNLVKISKGKITPAEFKKFLFPPKDQAAFILRSTLVWTIQTKAENELIRLAERKIKLEDPKDELARIAEEALEYFPDISGPSRDRPLEFLVMSLNDIWCQYHKQAWPKPRVSKLITLISVFLSEILKNGPTEKAIRSLLDRNLENF